MILGENRKYLCAILNSCVIDFIFPLLATDLGEKGNRYFKIFVDKIPIPKITKENNLDVIEIEKLATQILTAKHENPDADTSTLEVEIDQLVYKLYDLTPEEIAIVENSGNLQKLVENELMKNDTQISRLDLLKQKLQRLKNMLPNMKHNREAYERNSKKLEDLEKKLEKLS